MEQLFQILVGSKESFNTARSLNLCKINYLQPFEGCS